VAASAPAPAPAPAPVAAEAASPAVNAATAALAAVNAQDGAIPAAGTPLPAGVEVARVRRVMVAPRLKPSTVPAGTGADPIAAIAAAASVSGAPTAPVAAPAETAPARSLETLVATATERTAPPGAPLARVPLSFQDQMAALAANIQPAAFLSRAPEPAAEPAVAPGAPPSTLAAQAARIEAGEIAPQPAPPVTQPRSQVAAEPRRQIAAAAPPPPAYRLAGPEPRAATAIPAPVQPLAAGFQIQIGAYGSVAEAEKQIASVAASAEPLLAGHSGLTLPVAKGARQLYRARFAGFDANGAANACLELRRRQIDCFVMKAE
jgi:D-alanyl-D-alanine carboxypeptidase